MEGKKIYRAVGCGACQSTGYAGRTAVHEVLIINDEIRGLITKSVDAIALKKAAMNQGMLTLREAGVELILQGKTTVEEILALTQEDTTRG